MGGVRRTLLGLAVAAALTWAANLAATSDSRSAGAPAHKWIDGAGARLPALAQDQACTSAPMLVVLTRFNVVFTNSYGFRGAHARNVTDPMWVLEPARLRIRMWLLANVTVASLAAQTTRRFVHMIAHSTLLPEPFLSQLRALEAQHNFIVLLAVPPTTASPFTPSAIRQLVHGHAPQPGHGAPAGLCPLLTARLDDDDAVSPDYAQRVLALADKEAARALGDPDRGRDVVFSFALGYRVGYEETAPPAHGAAPSAGRQQQLRGKPERKRAAGTRACLVAQAERSRLLSVGLALWSANGSQLVHGMGSHRSLDERYPTVRDRSGPRVYAKMMHAGSWTQHNVTMTKHEWEREAMETFPSLPRCVPPGIGWVPHNAPQRVDHR
jgi:hypothetical protein